MNGFLSPEGKFYGCGFKEHCELADILVKKYNAPCLDSDLNMIWGNDEKIKKIGFIYFGYTGDLGTNTDLYVFLDFDNMQITNEQIEWVENNEDKLQVKQFVDFREMVELLDRRIK